MSFKVKMDGKGKLRAKIAEIEPGIRAATEKAVGREAHAIADDMRSNAPVDEGELVDSIISRHDGLEAHAAATAAHARYVEFGTFNHPEQPFVTPAAERARKRFPDRVRDAVKAAVG